MKKEQKFKIPKNLKQIAIILKNPNMPQLFLEG